MSARARSRFGASSWVIVIAAAAAAPLAVLSALGCNAILDNKEAASVGEPSTGDAGTQTDAGASADVSAPLHDGDADPGPCSPDKKWCFGSCVSRTDPYYGCAADACTACSIAHGAATCAGGACAVASCVAGFSDCDQDDGNGCETDLSQPGHCGTCNAACGTAAPLCTPSSGAFQCVNGCPGEAPTLCGKQCADLSSSVSHCGSCQRACPIVANGQAQCVSSDCQFVCDAGFHACGSRCSSNADPDTCGSSCSPCSAPPGGVATCSSGACGVQCKSGSHLCNGDRCASDDDTASCGGSCTPCPSPAHASATCDGTSCGFACTAPFADCDGDGSNGCEADTDGSAAHCGACNHPCAGVCVAGVCQMPDGGGADE